MNATILDLLDLEQIERDIFRGRCHEGAPMRAFGGQVAGQALMAAGRTMGPGLHVHSHHGYFLRAGDSRRPILFQVERPRDGRTYFARRVTAIQDGEAIFTLSASFKRPEDGVRRQGPMPEAGDPERMPDPYDAWVDRNPEEGARAPWRAAMSLRYVDRDPEPVAGVITQKVWIKSRAPLPDDPQLHACALTYGSDLSLAQTSALDLDPPTLLRETPSRVLMASLDHALWFHGPLRADDWLLFVQRSPSASDGRGFATGEFWNREGALVASAVQEAVLRSRARAGSSVLGQRT